MLDINYIYKKIKEDIQKTYSQLPEKIIDQYFDFTMLRSNWVTYNSCVNYENDQYLYILGIAKNNNSFYYIGYDDNNDIKTISCDLDINKYYKRDEDYLSILEDKEEFDKDVKKWSIIRKNIKAYLKKNKDYKIIFKTFLY